MNDFDTFRYKPGLGYRPGSRKPVLIEAGDFYPKFYGSFILNQPDKKEISNIITAAVTAAASAVVVVYVLILLQMQ